MSTRLAWQEKNRPVLWRQSSESVCVCAFMHAFASACVCVCLRVSVCVPLCVSLCGHLWVFFSLCVRVYMCRVCARVRAFLCVTTENECWILCVY